MRPILRIAAAALLFGLGARLSAATWYGSATGSGRKCTLAAPCALAFLLDGGSGGNQVKPGDTIELRLGTNYTLPIDNGKYVSLKSTLRGTAAARITIRPYPPDQTTPTSLIRIACDQGTQNPPVDCFTVESNDVDYWDIELAYFGDVNRDAVASQWDSQGFGTGVRVNADRKKTYGRGNRMIGWVIHDTADNFFKHSRANPLSVIDMIHYNWNMRYNVKGPPAIHRMGGHAYYIRNGATKACRDPDEDPGLFAMVNNIIGTTIVVPGENSASMAYQDYGSCDCDVMHRNERFEGNLFLAATVSGGCPAKRDFTQGTRDQTLVNNWWSSYVPGYFAAGCDGVTLAGNSMFRSMYAESDRYFANRSPLYLGQSRNSSVNPCRPGIRDGGGNVFWGNPNLLEGAEDDDRANGFKSAWFPGFTYLPNDSAPKRNYSSVLPSPVRPGRCNVYVANFLDAASVRVDIAACGIAPGAKYEIRSIYNYLGPPVATGTYDAGSPTIAFPMSQAANPRADSVGHVTGGAPNSYPEMPYSRPSATSPNIYKNGFVVLQLSGPEAAAPPTGTPFDAPAPTPPPPATATRGGRVTSSW